MKTSFSLRMARITSSRLSQSFLLVTALFVCSTPTLQAETAAAAKRNSAQAQFDRAEKQRAALNAKPLAERTLEEYKQTAASYRRVYLITPHATEVPAAIIAVAQLDREMGRRFGSKYFQLAVDTYGYLLKQYPTTRYREEALLAIALIEKNDLGQQRTAKKNFEQFLKLHPRSPHKREAMEALAEIAMATDLGPAPRGGQVIAVPGENKIEVVPASAKGSVNSEVTTEKDTPKDGVPRVTGVTTFNGQDKAQIVIALDKGVQFSSSRLAKPERIFFDLHPARIGRGVTGKIPESPSGILKTIRMAEKEKGVVRVVFEVQGAKEYTAALFDSPARLVIDLWGAKSITARNAAKTPNGTRPADLTAGKKVESRNRNDKSVNASAAASPSPVPTAPSQTVSAQSAPMQPSASQPASTQPPVSQPSASQPITPQPVSTQPGKTAPPIEAKLASPNNMRVNRGADRMIPPSAPEPTRNGKPSLTRALGLKVGRIVIDAGHGGRDTGTVGATGLMEKDLCLDIAMRLGKIIQQRLPGAEVIYTRQNDSFVGLEDRTSIANQAKADLFLSIHANSSEDHHARGVETYYLNLTNSSEAMAVASRENALARGGVHDLQDIVAKIARNEKLGESREFAEDVQNSLTKRLQKITSAARNRGVRKAPFVVLIGADMPSILSEISFLSNPLEEQLLKRPENRQRVAEGLYQGVVSYLQSVNSLSFNRPGRLDANRSTPLEQSGNQR